MKKRVLALILACTITLTNGNIAFAAEKDSENTTDTMVMEESETTQPKLEEDTETKTPEDVAESDTTENETADATNTAKEDKPEENVNTTSENTNSIAVETSEDVPAQGYATSGTYGENITWNFDGSTGTLTFSGSGNMADTPAGEYTPWEKNFRTEVKHIIINEGITNIGMNAFYAIDQAEDISIPQSVTVIKGGALQGCESIKELHLPNNLTNIGTDAFFYMASCKGFYIDEPDSKTAYHTEDGVLFCNQILITYPQGNTRASYRVPYGTEELNVRSFVNTPYLQTVYIPETMKKLNSQMFYNDFSWSVHMSNPVYIYFSTMTETDNMGGSAFKGLPNDSRIYVKTQTFCDKLNSSGAILNYASRNDDVRAEVYHHPEPYSAYEALKKAYANNSYRLNSGRTTLFRYESADAPTATDTTTWTSSNTEIAVSPNGMGYIKGGTQPGKATITVTREDKKESFSFTVENVVPTTSEKLYYKDGAGYSQELRDSLCIYTGENTTVNVKTEPELTTALAGKVTWTSSDCSKVSVKVGGTYNEKATLYRKARGDVTVTATMIDENGKVIEKTFCVTGYKTTYDWDISLDCDWIYVKDSTPVQPKVVVKDKDGTVLQEGRDYTLSYRDNYLPKGESSRTGYVCVFPIGEYTGADSEEEDFSIIMKNVTQTATNTKIPQWIWGIYQSSYDVSVGQSFILKPDAVGKITYKTSNKKVATVNSKGKVTVRGTGKATITVTAKATSTYNKGVKKITVYGVPKKPEMKKKTAGKKKFTVQWKKDKKADGYQVQYSADKKFKKNVKSVNVSKKTAKATVKKLKKGKTYRVRIRSYKKIDGKKHYSGWSKAKSVKIK